MVWVEGRAIPLEYGPLADDDVAQGEVVRPATVQIWVETDDGEVRRDQLVASLELPPPIRPDNVTHVRVAFNGYLWGGAIPNPLSPAWPGYPWPERGGPDPWVG